MNLRATVQGESTAPVLGSELKRPPLQFPHKIGAGMQIKQMNKKTE